MGDRTDVSVEPHVSTLEDDDPQTSLLHSFLVARGDTSTGGQQTLSQVRISLQEYSLDDLVKILLEYEQQYEMSTVEMFSQYIRGTLDPTGDLAEWLGIFLLYLNSERIREYYRR